MFSASSLPAYPKKVHFPNYFHNPAFLIRIFFSCFSYYNYFCHRLSSEGGLRMRSKHPKLLTRFIICYLFAIFIPIVLLSSMIYHFYANQRIKEYTTDRMSALMMEQNSLESQLENVHQYFTQLQPDYELCQLLHNIYTSELRLVYAYNTQIHSLLSQIRLYDQNIEGISIYTENKTAARILKEFQPMDEQPFPENPYPPVLEGLWQAESDGSRMTPVFYIGFTNPPMRKFTGILKINYNSLLFDQYALEMPDSAIYVYLNDELLFQYNENEVSGCLPLYEKELLASGSRESPDIILDEEKQCVISSFSLDRGYFHIIKITPGSGTLFSYKPFVWSLLISGLLLIIASIAAFCVVFRAMRNVVQLSEHMNRQNEPRLTLYTGKISPDETGDLTLAFNQMAGHINELSDSLLNSELQLKNAQIESLQAQLNPHFFYGTLESIRMIAEMNHQTLISEITFSFSNLMRYSLSREYLVPITRELDIIRQYLSIQEKRLNNRFDVKWDIPELNDKWRCPKFAIFSMVENVFSHNISKCKDFIHISISVSPIQTDMLITVKNTGPGISPERLRELHYLLDHPEERKNMQSENNGRSIFNISDRLKLFYGENYLFSIESRPWEETVCSIRVHR